MDRSAGNQLVQLVNRLLAKAEKALAHGAWDRAEEILGISLRSRLKTGELPRCFSSPGCRTLCRVACEPW